MREIKKRGNPLSGGTPTGKVFGGMREKRGGAANGASLKKRSKHTRTVSKTDRQFLEPLLGGIGIRQRTSPKGLAKYRRKKTVNKSAGKGPPFKDLLLRKKKKYLWGGRPSKTGRTPQRPEKERKFSEKRGGRDRHLIENREVFIVGALCTGV